MVVDNSFRHDSRQQLRGDTEALVLEEESTVTNAFHRGKSFQDKVLKFVNHKVRPRAIVMANKQDLRVALYQMETAVELICRTCGDQPWRQRRRTRLQGRVNLENQ